METENSISWEVNGAMTFNPFMAGATYQMESEADIQGVAYGQRIVDGSIPGLLGNLSSTCRNYRRKAFFRKASERVNRRWTIRIILASGVLGLALSSCAPTPLPLHTTVETLNIRKTPLTAALVMPDNIRNAISTPEVSCAGTFVVPIGSELKTGLTQAFSQLFESVQVVDDKSQATEDDVLIETAIPELQAEGHCGSRRTLYATGPLYVLLIMFITPSDTYEGHAELTATISSSQGQQVLSQTFKSKMHTKDSITDYSADRRSAIENVFRESLTDSIQQLTRTLATSSQLREYANRRKGKLEDRP